GDHHQVGRVFHPQPRRVDARHGDQPGHRAVILRAIDGDFRGLHGGPDLGAAVEVQVPHRARRYLRDQWNRAAQPHAHAVALQVELFRGGAPDVARGAFGPGQIECDRARVDDRQDLALAGVGCGEGPATVQLDVVVVGTAAQKVDAGEVGDETGPRPGGHVCGRSLLHDLALLHYDKAVG